MSILSESYRQLLTVIKLGLELHLISRAALNKWVVNEIDKNTKPDYFLIELAMSEQWNLNTLISYLKELIGSCDALICWRVIIGMLTHKTRNGEIGLSETNSILYNHLRENLSEAEISIIRALDFYLELDDYSDEAIRRSSPDFHAYLDLYSDLTLDNQEQWGAISDKIDENIKAL